ncbi:hypothetical protein JCGZ_24962 [Jatropha curcas]|uniref:MADS-box domain-containing protein n=1 Tax=Jatropha curcas TaxID=180498 RepID=A0A067L145_JATCU|nr:agamous-like MADS-box protein AGL62 [Jatropha curcas]KDP40963.1 hypothetical protein JCGZ_24962 [Jatropha curcas]
MSRKSRGRQKLEMVKISKESNLLVTFSKRRYGIFKKASELSTLCGAEVTVIVFSPGKKVFSFGQPSVEAVVNRFLSGTSPPISGAMQLIEAHRNARVRELNMQLTQILNQLEMEKKRGEELDQMKRVRQAQCWWESPIEDLDFERLQQLKASLEILRHTVTKQAEQLLIQTTNTPQQFYVPSTNTPQQFYATSSNTPQQFYAPSTSNTALLPNFDPENNGFEFNTNMNAYQYPNLGFGSSGLF